MTMYRTRLLVGLQRGKRDLAAGSSDLDMVAQLLSLDINRDPERHDIYVDLPSVADEYQEYLDIPQSQLSAEYDGTAIVEFWNVSDFYRRYLGVIHT